MKTKIKQHYRSVVSVLLSVCMLVSCMTVGLIATDAARVTDSDNVAAAATGEAVAAKVDDADSVGDGPNSVTFGYNWGGSGSTWDTTSINKDQEYEFTFSSAKAIEFYFQSGSTTWKYHSSQTQVFDTTNKQEFRGHSSGSSNLGFTTQAATYVLKYTGTNNNDLLYFNFYRKKSSFSITKTDDGNGTLSGPDTANKDSLVELTANPNRGYELDRTNSLLNGSTGRFTGTGNELKFTMPGSAVTAKAVFKTATKYTVNANVSSGTGTIGLTLKSGNNTVAAGSADNNASETLDTYSGEKLIINLSPGAGYKVSSVTITHNGSTTTYNTSPVSRTYTIETIAGNVTVTASFVEGSDTKNDYTAVKGDTITTGEAAGTVYSGIKATFYDYYTDGEVNSGWYNGIDSVKEGWTGDNWSYKIRNPYTVLNTALSRDASTNSVPYPMYFGVFAWGNPVNYYNPGYTKAQGGSPAYGQKINDSNFLDGNTKALPGLASDSLTGGAISHSNGTPMKMFDKTWLTTSGVDLDSNYIYFAPTRNEYVHFYATTPYFYAYFYKSSDLSDHNFVKMSKDDTTGFYRVNVQNGYDKVIICRMNPDSGSWDNRIAQTDDLNSSDCAGKLVKIDDNTSGADTKHAVKIISLTADSAMASFVNSAFPVRKTIKTTDGKSAVYYEFDSSPAHYDTIYFDDLDYSNPTSKTPKIQFSTDNKNKAVKPGYQDGTNKDAGFFPFDKTTSNGKGKDLALGMKLEFKFTLGKNESGQDGYILSTDNTTYIPQTFDFSGDDDLWVYVDDNLILDLGGDHCVTEGSINFATKTVTASVDNALTTAQSITRNGPFTLADKKVHTMTIYYMERGMHESNLKFGFSMSPLATDFSTEKELDVSALNAGIGTYNASTNPYGFTDTFDFTNTSYNSDGTTGNEHSKNKAYDYFQWDSTNSKYVHQNGTYSSDGSGKFSLTSDPTKQYADFDNKLKVGDVLNVVETSQKGYHYTTTYEVTDQEYLVEGSPALIKSGKGADTGKFNFKTVLPNADPQTDVTNIRVKFTNVLKTQTLDVTKVMQDNFPTAEKFTIQLGLKMENGGTETTLKTAGLVYKSSDDDFGTEHPLDPYGRAEIGANETLRFAGIPEGAKVTITEISKDGYSFVSMTHSETDANNPFTTSNQSATVTLNNYDTVTITNEKLFDLKIAKAMTGDVSDVQEGTYFPIQVWVKQPSGSLTAITSANYTSYTYDVAPMPTSAGTSNANDVYFNTTDGYFMLKPDKDFTIKGFKKNTEFKVVEHTGTVANCTYVSTVVSPSSGTTVEDSINNLYGYQGITVADANIDVTITNNLMARQNVTITKAMYNGYDSGNQTFNVKVELDTGSGYTAATKYYDSTNTEQSFASGGIVSLKKDDTITLKSLATGTKVRVTEPTMPEGTTYTYYSCTGSNTFTAATAVTDASNVEIGKAFTVGTADGDITLTNHHPVNYYTIEFNYPCYKNLYGTDSATNQTYVVHDVIGADLAAYFNIAADGSTGDLNKETNPDDKVNELIELMAPHENNFRSDLRYDKTCIETKADGTTWDINWRASTLQNGHYSDGEITFRLTAKTANLGNLTCDFKVPYEMRIVNNTIVVDSDAYTASGTTTDVKPTFMSRYYLNNDASGDNYFWAKEELSGDADHKYFQYWNIWRKGDQYTDANVIRRCFNPKFNYTFYESYHIEAVYGSTKQTPTEWSEDYGINASISFLENSRNQWNMGHGNQVGTVEKSYWQYRGDRVFSDFAISYAYNDLQLQLSSNNAIKTYMVIERLDELPNLQNDSGPVLDSHDVNVKDTRETTINSMIADVADDGKAALKDYILGGSAEGRVYIQSEIAKEDLDNKNCIEYYYNFANRKQENKTQPNDQIIPYLSDYTTVRNYLFRAYAVITDGTEEGTAVSDPAYFTVYDIASIENYHQKNYE